MLLWVFTAGLITQLCGIRFSISSKVHLALAPGIIVCFEALNIITSQNLGFPTFLELEVALPRFHFIKSTPV